MSKSTRFSSLDRKAITVGVLIEVTESRTRSCPGGHVTLAFQRTNVKR